MTVRDCLTNTLDELQDLQRFIHKLCEHKFKNIEPIGLGRIKCTVPDIVHLIISQYGVKDAGKVTVDVLEAINERNLSSKLSTDLANTENGENVADDEIDAPACTQAKPSEDTAISAWGIWSLSAMERFATENMDELYKALENNITMEEVKMIKDTVRRRKLKSAFLITAKDAKQITSNKQLRQYRSQSKGHVTGFPLKLVAGYLFEGMTSGGQRPSYGQRSEAPAGASSVDAPMPKSEKEPSRRCDDSPRKPEAAFTGELHTSEPTEAIDCLDVADNKGMDQGAIQDSGFEHSLSVRESTLLEDGEEKEAARDAGDSQSRSQVTFSSTSGNASQPIGSKRAEFPPSGARLTAKVRRKDSWDVENEIREKREAQQCWLNEQAKQILKESGAGKREQVVRELEASLEQVHNREHSVFCSLQARNCLVYTIRKGDSLGKVILLLQLPTEPDGDTFSSLVKSGDLKKANRFYIQYNMGVLGGISRTYVVFYTKGHADIRQYDYDESEFSSIRASLEVFIEQAVLPVLAVFLREKRKQGVFLEAEG
ncbi:uncharacterized protein [Heterodontus francisci]|uniref:uncharacterized protein isoform X2 n=1 Tax=Heterodontus francisci TaxID=7792 RepID=UPI00355C6630